MIGQGVKYSPRALTLRFNFKYKDMAQDKNYKRGGPQAAYTYRALDCYGEFTGSGLS